MSKYVVLVFISIVLHSKCVISQQDTLVFSNRGTFDQYIGYSFMDVANQFTPYIKEKIDSIFKSYDFRGDSYRCQDGFVFGLDLDSCGTIIGCSLPNKLLTGELTDFFNEVCSTITNSHEQILNKITLIDTTYIFQSSVVSFATFCDPPEVIFSRDFSHPGILGKKVLVFRLEDTEVIFDGFKKGCE